ncbi:hypothetical protein [Salibacterium salarium]|nr:hypothetical protein [Salibacterium salarium]
MSAIAPTVVGEEVYKWKDTLRITGEALNKEKANQLLGYYGISLML